MFVPGTSSLKSRPCTSAFRRDRCSAPEFLINMPRTSQNYSISITYAIICLPTTCSSTAAEDLPKLAPLMVSRLERCIADVSAWCASRRLQLNGDKTELLWFGSATHLRQLPLARSISVNNSVVQPVTVVRDLGVWIDSELSMREHVSRVAQICFFHLRRLCSVRRQLGRDVSARLVSALVLSRLDYCNAVLAGLPAATLAPLQRVLNAAARLVLDLKPRDHATPALREWHWLPIAQWIEYKLCLLVHMIRRPHTRLYLRPCSHRSPTYQHARRCAPPATATSSFHGRSGDSETVRSLSLHPVRGIGCRQN